MERMESFRVRKRKEIGPRTYVSSQLEDEYTPSNDRLINLSHGVQMPPHGASYGPYGYVFVPYGLQLGFPPPSNVNTQQQLFSPQFSTFLPQREADEARSGSYSSSLLSSSSSSSGTSTSNPTSRSTSSSSDSSANDLFEERRGEKFGVNLNLSDDSLASLCSVVGNYVTKALPDSNGMISVEAIDWNSVSESFPTLTPSECMNLWKQCYPNHLLARLPHGVIMYCPDDGNPRTSSNAGQAELKQANCAVNDLAGSGSNGSSDEPRSHQQSVSELKNPDGFGTLSASGSENETRPLGRETQSIKHLNENRRKNWTEGEEAMIEEMQKKYGNRWTYIAEKMGTGRTGTEVKNYWHNKQQRLALKLLRESQ